MDPTKTITHIGLCAGYGGIELGLKRVIPTLRTVALCEIEAFAIANLVAKMEAGLMDPAPIWADLKSFPYERFRDRVDILTGGYPCQPFSTAGNRAGADDPRHLWPFISAGIAAMRPSLCFFENVEGHISLGLYDVIKDLDRLGYRTTWGIFSAVETGAPHQRKRVFILSYRNDARLEGLWECGASQGRKAQAGHAGGRCDVWPSRPGKPQHAWEPPRIVGYSNSFDWGSPAKKRQHDAKAGQTSERKTKSTMGGNIDGSSSRMDYAKLCFTCDNRVDELRLLGNGVVPATAKLAFTELMKQIKRCKEVQG